MMGGVLVVRIGAGSPGARWCSARQRTHRQLWSATDEHEQRKRENPAHHVEYMTVATRTPHQLRVSTGRALQLLGSGVIERTQQDAVDNREDRRVDADPERQRQQRLGRECGRAPERAERMPQVTRSSSGQVNDRTSRYTSVVCVTPPKRR